MAGRETGISKGIDLGQAGLCTVPRTLQASVALDLKQGCIEATVWQRSQLRCCMPSRSRSLYSGGQQLP